MCRSAHIVARNMIRRYGQMWADICPYRVIFRSLKDLPALPTDLGRCWTLLVHKRICPDLPRTRPTPPGADVGRAGSTL
eukprot:gene22110-biopygen23683